MTSSDADLHPRLMQLVVPMAAAKLPTAVALLAVLVEHAPSEREGRGVDSTKCPDHNPKDHPGLYRAVLDHDVFDACPTCETYSYVTCSSWGCTSCGYPCDTLEVVEAAFVQLGMLDMPAAS